MTSRLRFLSLLGELCLVALCLVALSPVLAADPWEFESEAELAEARSEFKSQTPMRTYEKAQELIKKGGPQSYQDAIVRLRWCISREPESGRRRDKIRRWKKTDYYPYYHLALVFAWQGDWNSALRAIQREDVQKIEKSAFSVGYQNFMKDLNKVIARTQLVHLADELLRWHSDGVPLSIDAAHGETLVLAREKAATLAEKPAGPWRGGLDTEAAALAQDVGKSLLTIYRLELGARRRALEELGQAPWPNLLGPDTKIPTPARCEYAGNDLKHARDQLLRCAEESGGLLRLAASKACERAKKDAPAWCRSPSLPPWHEIVGLAGRSAPSAVATRKPAPQPKPVAHERTPKAEPTIPTPPPVADSLRTAQKGTHPISPSTRDLADPSLSPRLEGADPGVPSDRGLSSPGTDTLLEAEQPPPEPLEAMPLLRRAVRQLEEGGVDRVIERFREVDSDGLFPRSGRTAALCRLTFAYALHLKFRSFPESSDLGSRRAKGYLESEIAEQIGFARQADPAFVLPDGVFPGFGSPPPSN